MSDDLNNKKVKNIKLNVSAPFHCKYMKTASEKMISYINDLKMNELEKPIISNVTANETSSLKEIKSLLISQIEKKDRWLGQEHKEEHTLHYNQYAHQLNLLSQVI